jgi:hypothetical protein
MVKLGVAFKASAQSWRKSIPLAIAIDKAKSYAMGWRVYSNI